MIHRTHQVPFAALLNAKGAETRLSVVSLDERFVRDESSIALGCACNTLLRPA